MIPLLRPEVTATMPTGTVVKVDGGELTLDSLAVPYGSASVELPLNSDTNLDPLDPRDAVRIGLTGRDGTNPARVSDLHLRSREVDHRTKVVRLELATDEALAQDFATFTLDRTPITHQASLRAVCNYVLSRVPGIRETSPGVVLAPGPDDANLTAHWAVTNLMPNPAVRLALGNWIPGGSNASMVRETGWLASRPEGRDVPGLPGVTTATLTTWTGASGVGQGGAYGQTASVVPYVPVRPFTTYTVAVHALASVAKSVDLRAQVFGADGAILDTGKLVKTVGLPVNGWTRIVGTITTGANAGRLGPFLYPAAGQQWAAGNNLRTTGWMVYEGDRVIPYFDGATPADADYTYAFTGTASASASVRTPKVPRDPAMFDWLPGVSAWDFLAPLLLAGGLRLFCDEARVWRLVDPATYTIPGVVSLNPGNLVEGVDTIGRTDPEVFATGVVIRYAWKDSNDVPQVAYDTAGTEEKVAVLDYARAYPGAGAAAQVLARRDGTGRTQDVEALARWDASPGMQASITLPAAPEQRGKVISTRWTLGDEATMTVGTSGLVDIVPRSIDAMAGTIDALVGTIDAQ